MQHQHFLRIFLPLLLLLLACSIQLSETRGGRRGGGGMFSTWRKIKKPSSSSSSTSRRTQGQKYEVPYTPLKSVKPSKTQTSSAFPSYPRQQLPAGASYHATGASLPPGATYHGVAVPPGGSYYASAAAMPQGAIYYAQAPPQSAFSATNLLMGMYAGQMMSHGLFGHRTHVTHVYHENQQPQDSEGSKVMIIENGKPSGTSNDEQGSNNSIPTATTDANPSDASGIICVPLLIDESKHEVPKIGCYPAAQNPANDVAQPKIPPSAATAGIICMPHQITEADPSDATKQVTIEKQICYPAPPVPEYHTYEQSTKSPDSVIGNIAQVVGDDAEMVTPASQAAAITRQQTHAMLEALHQEEQRAMKGLFDA